MSYVLEAPVEDLKFLLGEVGLGLQLFQALWPVTHRGHLQLIIHLIYTEGGRQREKGERERENTATSAQMTNTICPFQTELSILLYFVYTMSHYCTANRPGRRQQRNRLRKKWRRGKKRIREGADETGEETGFPRGGPKGGYWDNFVLCVRCWRDESQVRM